MSAALLRAQDVINRVEGLEQMGRLTGVMDDRGKVRTSTATPARSNRKAGWRSLPVSHLILSSIARALHEQCTWVDTVYL